MSNLAQRIGAAAVFAPLIWGLVWWGSWPLELLVLACAAGMLRELMPLVGLGRRTPLALAATAATFASALGVMGQLPGWASGPALMAMLLLLVLACALAEAGAAADIVGRAGAALMAALWCGSTLSCLVLLRQLPEGGRAVALTVLAATWAQDTGAYFVGRLVGRRRLAPRWSPKKTWEGLMGGLWAAVGVALLARPLLQLPLSPSMAAGLGVVCTLGGVVGDLCESMVKRAAGVKDAGQLIPGHGGLFDRMDALLFTAPCALMWLGAPWRMSWP